MNLPVIWSKKLSRSLPKCVILATSRASQMISEEERRERHLCLIGNCELYSAF